MSLLEARALHSFKPWNAQCRHFSPIITPPQGAILGVGTMKDKPVVVRGQVMVKPIITLSLAFDHRILDGAPAAIFLNTIKEILESPSIYIEPP